MAKMARGTKYLPVDPTKTASYTDADVEAMADAALGYEPPEADPDLIDLGVDEADSAIAIARKRSALLVANKSYEEQAEDLLAPRRKAAFLQTLARTGNPSMAAASAGWSRAVAEGIRKTDTFFDGQYKEAIEVSSDYLEAEMFRRAVVGVEKAVWHKGEVVGYETIYSDSLLKELAKGARPKKFGNQPAETNDGPVRQGVLVLPPKPTEEEWIAQAEKNQAKYRENTKDKE